MDPVTIVVDNCEVIENNIKANYVIHKEMKLVKNKILCLYPNRDPNFYCSPIKRIFFDDHFEHILRMDHGQSLNGNGTLTFTVTAIWKKDNSFGPAIRFDSFEEKKDDRIPFLSDSESDIDLN